MSSIGFATSSETTETKSVLPWANWDKQESRVISYGISSTF